MRAILAIVGAAAAGALTMYYFDPQLGRHRRALVRDKTVSTYHDVGDFARKRTRRAGDRLRGLGHALRPSTAPSDDHTLHERIRAKLGRMVTHPRAVHVEVDEGRVRLTGHILIDEVDRLIAMVSAMKGVDTVDNQLEVHEDAGNIPALQGEGRIRRLNGRLRPALPLLALTPVAIALMAARRTGAPRVQTRH